MDRERAIKELRISECYSIIPSIEALDFAIKALEQPSMEVVSIEDVAKELGCSAINTTMEWLDTLTTLEKYGYTICKVKEK